MYMPNEKALDIHDIKRKDKNYKVTQTVEIECDTLSSQLSKLNIDLLDYLKIIPGRAGNIERYRKF